MTRFLLGFLLFAPAACRAANTDVIVFMRFEEPPDLHFPRRVESGVNEIFKSAGVKFEWLPDETVVLPPADRQRRIQLNFRGKCTQDRVSDGLPVPLRIRLGWTLATQGQIEPFATIDCDAIAVSVHSYRVGVKVSNQTALYQRLASRVVAHELLHILLGTTQHHDDSLVQCWRIEPAMLMLDTRLTSAEIRALKAALESFEVAARGR